MVWRQRSSFVVLAVAPVAAVAGLAAPSQTLILAALVCVGAPLNAGEEAVAGIHHGTRVGIALLPGSHGLHRLRDLEKGHSNHHKEKQHRLGTAELHNDESIRS